MQNRLAKTWRCPQIAKQVTETTPVPIPLQDDIQKAFADAEKFRVLVKIIEESDSLREVVVKLTEYLEATD